jgi:hypothetical protein
MKYEAMCTSIQGVTTAWSVVVSNDTCIPDEAGDARVSDVVLCVMMAWSNEQQSVADQNDEVEKRGD